MLNQTELQSAGIRRAATIQPIFYHTFSVLLHFSNINQNSAVLGPCIIRIMACNIKWYVCENKLYLSKKQIKC